ASFRPHLSLHSFPTRRSSDLSAAAGLTERSPVLSMAWIVAKATLCGGLFRVWSRLHESEHRPAHDPVRSDGDGRPRGAGRPPARSEEHTSELQSRSDLVCRLL